MHNMGMPASKDISTQTYARDSRICANFRAQNPGHCLRTLVAFRIHKLHNEKTYQLKTNSRTGPDDHQLGLIFCQTLGINANYKT